ncbi:insulin receptor substrate 1 [Scleropages formosus]|uniref:insulin receptor substrate 1 n=1 Tax=Scleropages formosus TaxID=113540 RepID=UPI0010FAC537|nr:insulin receptor substrate 1-like [Scleropages formosus]
MESLAPPSPPESPVGSPTAGSPPGRGAQQHHQQQHQQQQQHQLPPDDVRRSGYLRKHKSAHRRFFVLRAASERGPARLECYDSEKKFRGKPAPVPKKSVNLETCFNINKRADSRHRHMIVLYTRAESFAVAAESGAEQDEWYRAMVELQCRGKAPGDGCRGGDYGAPSPGPAFKEVWQVKVWPKGLGQAKNLVGTYRLCLTDKTVNFVKLNSDAAAVVLQLMNVRRCGHSENFFFVEVGRSAITGPGEFWMQVEDSVVAQNMHETLLEAMKALSEEFRQRSKSQSAAAGGGAATSTPIGVPSRRLHPNPPPSQVGFLRRARAEPPASTGGSGGGDAGASSAPRHGTAGMRATSDGSEESGAVAEATGPPSCSGTPVLRCRSVRGPSPAKTPHGLTRSMSTPAPPAGPSLSSGQTSEPAGGASSTLVSGSPSDCGSSDECGSSPGEHCPGEDASSYILMGQQAAKGGHGVLRRSSSRDSKRASLPPMALERMAPRRRPEEDAQEDYAVMSRSASRESFTARDKEEVTEGPGGGAGAGAAMDNGYMAMLPGVTAASPTSPSPSLSVSISDSTSKAGDDYMAMTPSSSVSPPRHIRAPPAASDGYMMMSPHSSCSPVGVAWPGSDYMNMSPIGARSASSTPPPHLDPLAQQPPPKTVCSYYSLPRSYKHSPRGPFEEDGRLVVRGNSGGFSSFSSSSDSAGEAAEREGGGAIQRGQERGPQKQVHQKRSRPVSLFIDVSKANTLPRVREAPCAAEPKSPGEYVSIEFRREGRGGPGPLRRPISCVASEYVNMDLGGSPSPSPLSLTPLGFPLFPAPPTPPPAAPKASKEQEGPVEEEEGPCGGHRRPRQASRCQSPALFADYTEMVFGPSESGALGSGATPTAPSPGKSDMLGPGRRLALELDFPLAGAGANADQGAKVICADPQGRRRHCSETFQAPPAAPSSSSSSSSSPFPENAQVAACRFGFGLAAEGTCQAPDARTPPVSSAEQGLNYIDLDLANKEGSRSTVEASAASQTTPPRLFCALNPGGVGGVPAPAAGGGSGSSPSGLNAYASIDFYRSEELRAHQGGAKGGTEC